MEKIADLLDAISGTADISADIRDAFLKVGSDSNYLIMKPVVDKSKWCESYRSVFGCYPTLELFQQNADAAIKKAEEFLGFEKQLASVNPDYQPVVQQAEEILRRVKTYRQSLPDEFGLPCD